MSNKRKKVIDIKSRGRGDPIVKTRIKGYLKICAFALLSVRFCGVKASVTYTEKEEYTIFGGTRSRGNFSLYGVTNTRYATWWNSGSSYLVLSGCFMTW